MDSPRSENTAAPADPLHVWFATEVQPHDAPLKAYLRGAFPSVRDVDDVVQESYLRLLRTRAERPLGVARAYLFRIARHLAVDLLRRETASPVRAALASEDLATVVDSSRGVAESVCAAEEIALLGAAIAELPDRCRDVFVLRKLHGLSQKEIAARLGLSEQTVQVQVSRGVKRCGHFLRRHHLGVPQSS